MLNERRHAERVTDTLRLELAVGRPRRGSGGLDIGTPGRGFPYYGPDTEISNPGRGGVALVTASPPYRPLALDGSGQAYRLSATVVGLSHLYGASAN
jgi:hypothetical protein